MSIGVHCDECGKTYQVRDTMAGRCGKCPNGHPITVPNPAAEPAPAEENAFAFTSGPTVTAAPSKSARRRPAPAAEPEPDPTPAADATDDFSFPSHVPGGSRDDAPAPKSGRHRPERKATAKEGKPNLMPLILGGILAVLGIGGGVTLLVVSRGEAGPLKEQADAANKKAAAAEERAQKAEALKLAAEADLDKLKKSPPRDPALAETQKQLKAAEKRATDAEKQLKARKGDPDIVAGEGAMPKDLDPSAPGGKADPVMPGGKLEADRPGKGKEPAKKEMDKPAPAGPNGATPGKNWTAPETLNFGPAQLQSRRPAGAIADGGCGPEGRRRQAVRQVPLAARARQEPAAQTRGRPPRPGGRYDLHDDQAPHAQRGERRPGDRLRRQIFHRQVAGLLLPQRRGAAQAGDLQYHPEYAGRLRGREEVISVRPSLVDADVRVVAAGQQPAQGGVVGPPGRGQGQVRAGLHGRRVEPVPQGLQGGPAVGGRGQEVERPGRRVAVGRPQPAVGQVADRRVPLVLQQPGQERAVPVGARGRPGRRVGEGPRPPPPASGRPPAPGPARPRPSSPPPAKGGGPAGPYSATRPAGRGVQPSDLSRWHRLQACGLPVPRLSARCRDLDAVRAVRGHQRVHLRAACGSCSTGCRRSRPGAGCARPAARGSSAWHW